MQAERATGATTVLGSARTLSLLSIAGVPVSHQSRSLAFGLVIVLASLAPSSMAQKRSFAEILKERHRFPPVSENGPTLTPPVLRNASGGFDDDPQDDDDITP